MNSWVFVYSLASSVAWLMSTICFSRKVVSVMSEHTRTDQRVVFRVTTARRTPDADWSWQTASGVLGSAKCGSARDFFFLCCVCLREREERYQMQSSERSGGRASKREVRRVKLTKKKGNAEEWETAFFNYYLLSHKARRESRRGAKQKHPLCKQYG